LAGVLDDVLRRLLPPWVAVHVVAFDERAPAAGVALPPEIARAVPRRRAEFIAGRTCARAALAAAGGDPAHDLPIGPLRAPQWPAGFVGSITHAAGFAAAAVAPSSRSRGLGIDLERTLSPTDVERLAATLAHPGELALASLTALFAAKEALFKALAPHVGRYFDFLDVAAVAAAADRLTFLQRCDLSAEFPAGATHEARVATAGDAWLVAAVHLAI
jgi:enterobactin synthetase component D